MAIYLPPASWKIAEAMVDFLTFFGHRGQTVVEYHTSTMVFGNTVFGKSKGYRQYIFGLSMIKMM